MGDPEASLFLVDVAIVWKTIQIDLPGMADQILLLEKMQAEEE
jgi:uncharacterized protein with HEPN domain